MHALFVRPPTPPHLCSHGRCKCRSHLCRKPRARWNMPSVESVDIHARPGKELTQRLEDAVAGLKGRLLTQRYPEPDSGRRWQSISGKAVRSNAWTGVLLDRTWRQNGPCRLTASGISYPVCPCPSARWGSVLVCLLSVRRFFVLRRFALSSGSLWLYLCE